MPKSLFSKVADLYTEILLNQRLIILNKFCKIFVLRTSFLQEISGRLENLSLTLLTLNKYVHSINIVGMISRNEDFVFYVA